VQYSIDLVVTFKTTIHFSHHHVVDDNSNSWQNGGVVAVVAIL
jgi:hypothetical protein